MLRVNNLASGSAGNATLVQRNAGSKSVSLLIDCGPGVRQLTQLVTEAGLDPESIDGIFITHEHSDHWGCVIKWQQRYGTPVWMSRGTWMAMGSPSFCGPLNWAHDSLPIDLKDGLEITPVTVPHDAREPLQLRCSDGSRDVGILTDLGHSTLHLERSMQHCHALVIECNHDSNLLARGPYPPSLKQRVGGDWGHLSNAQAAGLVGRLNHPELNWVMAAHLSAENNRPDLAQDSLATPLNCPIDSIHVALQNSSTGWLNV